MSLAVVLSVAVVLGFAGGGGNDGGDNNAPPPSRAGGVWAAVALSLAVALGVAVGISLGCFRIVSGILIHYFIISGYVVVVVQTLYAPRMIIPLAYDSGGVTTSTVTVPLVAALGFGLAENVPGRSALIDGFGLIAFASLFPIMSVMAYAQIAEWRTRRAAIRKVEGEVA